MPLQELEKALNLPGVELFDLLCHIAYHAPPLTRRERADNVKKRNYFAQYGAEAQAVLLALLEKYIDRGIENLENLDALKVNPLSELGSHLELLNAFEGKEKYLQAVQGLEREIYQIA